MKKKLENQLFVLRIKVKVIKGQKCLIISEIQYDKDGCSDWGIELFNDKGTEINLSVNEILKESKSLIQFLRSARLVSYVGHMHIAKLEGRDFDAIVINDPEGYVNAINDYEQINKQKI